MQKRHFIIFDCDTSLIDPVLFFAYFKSMLSSICEASLFCIHVKI